MNLRLISLYSSKEEKICSFCGEALSVSHDQARDLMCNSCESERSELNALGGELFPDSEEGADEELLEYDDDRLFPDLSFVRDVSIWDRGESN